MTQKKLERLARLWQKRLRLQDWKLTILLVDEIMDEEKENLFGHSLYDPSEWNAIIKIENGPVAERTLVHELLHLRLAPFTGILRELKFKLNPEDKASQETAINLLADSLLTGFRASRKTKELAPK